MKITWLGHASFRIEIEDQVLLLDPWLDGNPSFPDAHREEAIGGATAILLTHGHGDHASEVGRIATELGVPVYCIFELGESGYFGEAELRPFGKGGTVAIGAVKVSMVNAVHSASVDWRGKGLEPAGSEAGFMIAGEGHTIYATGDTDIMADMGWFGEYYAPDIGILCCGGHFTMDMDKAAWAAKRYFDFRTVIPCHYGTFDALAQSPQELVEKLPGVDVRTPKVMESVEI
ncbi:metal-dependent hydrolase [Wenxinia saemankumensis]|uniref:L-ascorbate metabolism protein UlaG, beta-lactamase superfamily n=1 Tax=Wenxinia saemankumensis TaxID=1447782 RepID=A0A1M6ATA5_9RHOB|nr:metal-dependent hydrolase [Wenxinia saemankumensis]SHI39700.1 L-ascorbate metabolism protein UlaG, beta-lactamase superfamily [Wenxinia saemankumensis]